ncbi:MAG: YggT family protein [Pseudomonadota bacterium]|nr:YggT family protein [Pseudomonadota bacterium]
MGAPLAQAATYLIQTLVSLYLIVVMLRFLLQLVRADFYNPISQFVVRATDALVRPLRKVIPGFGGLDLASLLLALLIQALAFAVILILAGFPVLNPIALLGWSLVALLSLTLDIFFFALLIVIVLSWVAPNSYNPAALLLRQLTEPVMEPVRRVIPPLGGLDLSPIVVFILINLIDMLVVRQLAVTLHMPRGLALGL